MSFYGSYSSGGPTHQYYTLSLVNPPKSANTDQFPIDYRETRNSPFLKDPESYYASVVRFSCTTPLLPIFIPAIRDPAINETEYSITMQHPSLNGGVPIVQHVIFQTSNPNLEKTGNNEYYYIYQPNDWIACVNKTLTSIWTALGTSLPGDAPFIEWLDDTSIGKLWLSYNLCRTPRDGATFPTTYPAGVADAGLASLSNGDNKLVVLIAPPSSTKYTVGDYVNTTGFTPAGLNVTGAKIIKLDTSVGELTLDIPVLAPITVTGSVTANTPIGIFMNASMYNLFSSFTAINLSSILKPSPAFGMHWKLIIAPTYETVTPPANYTFPQYGTNARTGTPYTYISQQYSTIPLWNPVSSFVFITSILPINPESISGPAILNTTFGVNGGNNSAVGTVLTDFEISLDKGWENKPTISYAPQAEYRLVDMNGNSDLSNIQISIGWRNKLGVFIPLNIGPNGHAQIKLMFRKKDYNGI